MQNLPVRLLPHRSSLRRWPRNHPRNLRPFAPDRKGYESSRKGTMGITAAELTQGRLCKNDCTGFFEFLNDKGVSIRIVVFEQNRAQRRRHALGIGLILNDNRNPVQWSDETCGLERVIKTIRLFKGRGI